MPPFALKTSTISLIGFTIFTAPVLAYAQLDCEQLRDALPISTHYVGPAIQRAQDGITYATEAQTNDDFFSYYLPGWAHSVASSFAQLVGGQQQGTQRIGNIAETTACLRYDQILLECALKRVEKALDAELERGSFFAIMQLQSIVVFLQERLEHLALGSEDSSHEDATYATKHLFDRDDPPEQTEPLCPFHSDYTPARMTGYGCDATVLRTIQSRVPQNALPFVQAELDGWTAIRNEIASFQEAIPASFRSTASTINVKQIRYRAEGQAHYYWACHDEYGNNLEPPVYDRDPPSGWCFGFRLDEHQTLIGCQENIGTCSNDTSLLCGSDEFCASKNAGLCQRNADDPTIPKRAVRGVFSFPRDHVRILTDFMEKRINDGLARTFPPSLSRFEDLPEGGDDALSRASDDNLLISGRTSKRVFFRSISADQGRREGAIFPEAQDSQLEIADALSDMRTSIGELSRLASQPSGMRTFIAEFAYFLRRTCAFRPCQKSLEQIIRISLADSCFPYTNGQFLSGGPAWKQCAMDACIQVDDEEGNPLELPEQCEEILP